jgi:group I intron endonuclease
MGHNMYNKYTIMIGIYRITSPSNKTYVGQSIDIEKRFKQYKRLACKRQPKLYNSFLKYGVENHIFEILEECFLGELNVKEILWKQKYNTVSEGLNCELFDIGQGPRSFQVKDKISKSMTGKAKTKEHCQNLSLAKRGIPSSRKGKPDLKQKGKPKPGAGNKGQPKIGAGPKKGNKIFNIETGKIYNSIKECMGFENILKKKMFLLLKDPQSNYKYLNKDYWKTKN